MVLVVGDLAALRSPCWARRVLVLILLALGRNTEAAPIGDIVYDNGPLFIGAGAASDLGGSTSGIPIKIADQFRLGRAITVKAIRFWGSYILGLDPVTPPLGDHFAVAFYANDGVTGLPAELIELQDLEVSRTNTGLTNPQGFDIYSYESGLHPFRLKPAGTYWISVYNNTPDPLLWFWTYSGQVGSLAMSVGSINGGEWFALATEGNLSFQLMGVPKAVPEPGWGVFALVGLAAVLVRRRSRKALLGRVSISTGSTCS